MRLLVVEDHEFERWALANMLSKLGARHVLCAVDGRSAIEILDVVDAPVDVVVCDLDMPGMDGMELLRHISTRRSTTAVIISSGLAAPLVASIETMAKAYGVRLLGTLRKPAKADQVERLLERYRRAGVRAAKPPCVPLAFSDGEFSGALANGEFEAFFQPKVRVCDSKVSGAEALARWNHPDRGLLAPDVFMRSLEKRGFGTEFAVAMAEASIRACRTWTGLSMAGTVSVNLSVGVLKDLTLVDRFMALVRSYRIDTRQVIFEVTEHTSTSAECLENLSRLRMKGFGLSLDDFGIAYSSMERLASIAFTELKIDRAFVTEALRSESNRAVLDASLDMARKLSVAAVGEGVETEEEWNLLRECGCPLAQGYLIGRPMNAPDYEGWLVQRRFEGLRAAS